MGAKFLGAVEDTRRMALHDVRVDVEKIVAFDGGHPRPFVPVMQPLRFGIAHAGGDNGFRVGFKYGFNVTFGAICLSWPKTFSPPQILMASLMICGPPTVISGDVQI
jgi:hypothetical protein